MAKSGQSLVAESIGTVRVKMLVKGKWLVAVVHDVLYVPGLQSNLFSVRRIEDNGMSLKIAGGKVSIQKKKSVVLCVAVVVPAICTLWIFSGMMKLAVEAVLPR